MNKFLTPLIGGIVTATLIFTLDPVSYKYKLQVKQSSHPKPILINTQELSQNLKTTTKPFHNDTLTELSALLSGDTAFNYTIYNAYATHTESKKRFIEFSKNWINLESTRLKKVSKFSDDHIYSKIRPQNILYPFSGPDILFAHHFFKPAKRYFLIGLEPCGSIPDFLKSPKPDVIKFQLYLHQLHNAIEDVTHFSFFRTIDMNTELSQQTLDGTLHILLLFLGKMQCIPFQMQYFEIQADGKLTYSTASRQGIEILFTNAQQDTCTIHYLSANLNNSNFKENGHLYSFLKSNAFDMAYLKGASYLLHNTEFSYFRSYLLAHLPAILQDDTGIPLRFFEFSNWNFELFGTYTKPIRLFKNRYQNDLDSFYKSSKPIPLGFGLGYNFKNQNSALIFAQKKH